MATMVKVSDVFDVRYGVNLELNALERDPNGVNFVSRTENNNGVAARVRVLPGVEPIPAGTLSVAGGGSVMATFLQPERYYSGRDLYYLTAKVDLTDQQKLFYCLCLRSNRYRFHYGRQANRTLRDLLIPAPEGLPSWVTNSNLPPTDVTAPLATTTPPLLFNVQNWRPYRLDELFAVKKGRRLIRRERVDGPVPFIGAAKKRNGIVSYVAEPPMFPAGSISIPYNGEGGTGFATYQPAPFSASDDVQVLEPLPPTVALGADQAALMFVCVVLRRERYRYSFGRKWHLARMRETTIRLPTTPSGSPDWPAMSAFMKALQYSRVALS
jgi:hypothetical protein